MPEMPVESMGMYFMDSLLRASDSSHEEKGSPQLEH